MTGTASYQAGVEATQSQIAYGIETTWGTAPASAFQLIRMMSETLASSKTRTRPNEIITTAEMAAAVTTDVKASGDISFALSWQTFDDFFAGALKSTWQSLQSIAGATGDITMTAGASPVLSSTTSNKFQNISVGQWIRTLGFTNAGNNGYWRVTAKADSQHLTLAGLNTAVTETPSGTAAQVRASTILNGSTFTSFYLEKKFSSSLFLKYPGAFCSGFSVDGGVGKYLQGKFMFLAQSETNGTTSASTGSYTAAPSGRVVDPVGGFVGALWNNAAIGATVDSFSLQLASKSAAQEYGMGSSAAQGIIMGQAEVSGALKLFFKDFTLYQAFLNETQAPLSLIVQDPAANGYVFTLPAATLMDPKINAGGPNQPVYASFTIEGNPQSSGGTLQIDRLASS